MGCSPSKAVRIVPATLSSTHSTDDVSEAPSSTDASSTPPCQSKPSPPQNKEQRLASELQLKLLLQMSLAKSLGARPGGSHPERNVFSSSARGGDRPESAPEQLSTQPVALPRPLRYPPQLQLESDSQIEFFKMLDKKIEEGPDYEEVCRRQKLSDNKQKSSDSTSSSDDS